jgi:hypothetical protein
VSAPPSRTIIHPSSRRPQFLRQTQKWRIPSLYRCDLFVSPRPTSACRTCVSLLSPNLPAFRCESAPATVSQPSYQHHLPSVRTTHSSRVSNVCIELLLVVSIHHLLLSVESHTEVFTHVPHTERTRDTLTSQTQRVWYRPAGAPVSVGSIRTTASSSAGTCSHPTTGFVRPAMVDRLHMPHPHGVRHTATQQHNQLGEHGGSWSLDREAPRLFLRNISCIEGAPSALLATPSSTLPKKRKRSPSPLLKQLLDLTDNTGGLRSPKRRAAAERKPLADTQNLTVATETPLVLKTPETTLEFPNNNSNMAHPYPPVYITPLPPSFVAALSSPAAAACATATSYRQRVQQYADKLHYAVYTNYHPFGPGHAQAWCAQITLTKKVRGGQEVAVINHTSARWYSNQADAKEAASNEVWLMLLGRS